MHTYLLKMRYIEFYPLDTSFYSSIYITNNIIHITYDIDSKTDMQMQLTNPAY